MTVCLIIGSAFHVFASESPSSNVIVKCCAITIIYNIIITIISNIFICCAILGVAKMSRKGRKSESPLSGSFTFACYGETFLGTICLLLPFCRRALVKTCSTPTTSPGAVARRRAQKLSHWEGRRAPTSCPTWWLCAPPPPRPPWGFRARRRIFIWRSSRGTQLLPFLLLRGPRQPRDQV